MSIRARLALVVAATLLPCVALIGVGVGVETARGWQRALDEHEAQALRIAERLAAAIEQVRATLLAVEAGYGDRLEAGAANDEGLRRAQAGAPRAVAWLSLLDAEGRIASSSGVPLEERARIRLADRDYFQQGMRTRAFTIGPPTPSRLTGEPIVVMAQPIPVAGDGVRGFAIAVVEIARMEELLASPAGGLVTVTTDRGEVLLATGRRDLWGTDAGALPQHAAGRAGSVFRGLTTDVRGGAVIGASVPVRNAPWQVFHASPRDAVLAEVYRRVGGLVAAAAVALLAGLALAWWVAGGLMREILQLRRGVNTIARGNLAHRMAAPIGGEMAQLAADVNRMAEKLGEAEQRLRSLVALSSDFFWEADADWRLTRLEGQVHLPDGQSFTRALGGRFVEFGYRLNGDVAVYQGVVARREPFRDVELVRCGEDRAIVQVLRVSGEPLFGADGGFLGYRGVGRDATERNLLQAEVRRAQHSLALSEARFRSVAEMSSDWIWETDAEHRFTYLSAGFERTTGFAVADALGKRRWDIPAANLATADWAAHRALLERREPFSDLRLERIAADGRRVVQSVSGRPMFSPEGEFLGYRGIGHDVTAQVLTEEALRAERDRLTRVLETMVEGVVMLDRDGRFVLLNGAAERVLGIRREEFIGRHYRDVPWRRVAFEEDRDALPETVFEHLRRGEVRTIGPARYAIERADGTRRILAHRAVRVDDGAGGFAGVLATFEDVTERVAAEEEHRREILALHADLERRVEERTAELALAYKEMEAFSYSVSHDLRAPLRAISGLARILLEDFQSELPPEAGRLLARVAQNAERMGALIDGLLEFGRLARQPLRLSRLRPADLVREVLEELAPQREGRRIEIHLGDMPECEADRLLLKQVYANLIGNAIKYSARRSVARIEIGAITMGLGPVYYVRDNGAGFDMAYAGKLFGMFQRLHLPAEFEGNGIGLALVRRIIERHGGKVWADSAPDRGATFFFRLGAPPAARAGGAQAAA